MVNQEHVSPLTAQRRWRGARGTHDGAGRRDRRTPSRATRDEVLVPWLDQPAPSPFPPQFVQLEVGGARLVADRRTTSSSSSTTSTLRKLDAQTWRLGITGLVARPQSLCARRPQTPLASRADRHAGMLRRSRLPVLHRGRVTTPAGRARRWRRSCSERASQRTASEVVFYGADSDAAHDPRQPGRPQARRHRRR